MDRRTKICIWVIMLGLANFLAYVLLYVFFDGEAIHGQVVQSANGAVSHFVRSNTGQLVKVSRATYIYSGIHSTSIWVTVGAVMLAMLTLAKERIASSMRATILRGRTFITILATIITLLITVMTILFILRLADKLCKPEPPPSTVSYAWLATAKLSVAG